MVGNKNPLVLTDLFTQGFFFSTQFNRIRDFQEEIDEQLLRGITESSRTEVNGDTLFR